MNKVFISFDHMLFLQDFSNTDKHKHKMKHITIDMEGYMSSKIDYDIVKASGYILGQDVFHERYAESIEGSKKMIFLIEPSSYLSKGIDKLLNGQKYILLSKSQIEEIANLWKDNMQGKTSSEIKDIYNDVINKIFMVCGIYRNRKMNIDSRIQLSLDIIKNTETITDDLLGELINKVNLSKSRFSHLFKENVGISYKNFLLIRKFINTWRYLAKGENITDACIHGGFFDSAHYTHFMSQCFGMITKEELNEIDEIVLIDNF